MRLFAGDTTYAFIRPRRRVLTRTPTNTGVLAATLPSATAALTGQGETSGSLTASIPSFVATLSGESTASGSIGASLPGLSAALAAAGTTEGTLAVPLPTPTAALAAENTGSGVLAAALPSATGTLSGGGTAEGTVSASLPALTVVLGGAGTAQAVVLTVLPELQAGLAAASEASGGLSGSLPATEGSFVGIADTEDSLLLVVLPELENGLDGEATTFGVLGAAIPALDLDLVSESSVFAILVDGIDELEASFAGHVELDFEAELNIVLPVLGMYPRGWRSIMIEMQQQRTVTQEFILASPVDIALIPGDETRTPSGAVIVASGVPRPVQRFRLIPMSHTERPSTSTSGAGAGSGGQQRKYDLTLLGEWDAVVQPNDYWFDVNGQKYVVDAVIPYNGYEVKGLVMSYGRRGSIV